MSRAWLVGAALPVALAAVLLAQDDDPPPAIQKDGIVNAASEMPPMFGGGALAPGSAIRIRGWRLGPAKEVLADPKQLSAQLSGMSVEIRQGQIRLPLLLSRVSANEIEAVLPTAAPLGDAQILISHEGHTSESFPVRLVKSSFGAAVSEEPGWGQAGVFFNGWPLESAERNRLTAAAQPGQTVTMRGTGLGVLRMPELEIRVAGKLVRTIRHAGQSACCPGYDDIAFDLPVDTPEGCHVPVQVRTAPGIASNFVTLAVAKAGRQCRDAAAWASTTNSGVNTAGMAVLHHSDMLLAVTESGNIQYKVDAGFAKFVQNARTDQILRFPPLGTCTTTERMTKLKGMLSVLSPLDAMEGTPIDAGASLTVEGGSDRRTIGRLKDSPATYSAVLGGNSPIPSAAQFPLFLRAGPYKISAAGPATGTQTGPFHADVTVSAPIEWTNRSRITAVDRSKGVTLTWKPAHRDDLVLIVASNVDGESGSLGMSVCLERASAARFVIPPQALTNIPATRSGQQLPLNLLWMIEVPGTAPKPFQMGSSEAIAFFTSSSVRTVAYR